MKAFGVRDIERVKGFNDGLKEVVQVIECNKPNYRPAHDVGSILKLGHPPREMTVVHREKTNGPRSYRCGNTCTNSSVDEVRSNQWRRCVPKFDDGLKNAGRKENWIKQWCISELFVAWCR